MGLDVVLCRYFLIPFNPPIVMNCEHKKEPHRLLQHEDLDLCLLHELSTFSVWPLLLVFMLQRTIVCLTSPPKLQQQFGRKLECVLFW